MSFLNIFTENVRIYPDKVALEFIDPPLQRVTYAELDELVQRTTSYLQSLGLQPGDRVALQLSKCLEFILLHLATVQLGAISLPLNLAYPPDELKYFLEDSGAKLFFALDSSKEKNQSILSQLPDLQECVFLNPSKPEEFQSLISNLQFSNSPITNYQSPTSGFDTPLDEHSRLLNHRQFSKSPVSSLQDTAIIIYTSGTTGRPKGAEITHGNLISNLEALHEAWGWQPDDTLLHVLPIFHVHGLFVALHGALYAGATTLLTDASARRRTVSAGRSTHWRAGPT